jgi:hypothetical protein
MNVPPEALLAVMAYGPGAAAAAELPGLVSVTLPTFSPLTRPLAVKPVRTAVSP